MTTAIDQKGLAFLSSNTLKWIALAFMTIDHIAAFGMEIPMINRYYWGFRIAGRIAAPLFLFILAESLYYTRSKVQFTFRLYCAGVGAGLFTAVTNLYLGETVGLFEPGNIMFTMFYVALIVTLLDGCIEGFRKRDMKKLMYVMLGCFLIIIPIMTQFIMDLVQHRLFSRFTLSTSFLVKDCYNSFLPAIQNVEYGIIFILMGVVFYFLRDKYFRCMAFVVFCAFCFFGTMLVDNFGMTWMQQMTGYPQYFMILALPFMLLYSGRKGRSTKMFFYVYYPVHRYLISVLVVLLGY